MKTKKLLRKIKSLLSADRRAQIAKADSLEEILRKLERKEQALRAKLDEEKDKARSKEILRKLEVIAAQRKKGEKLGKKITALRDAD
jgi:hypothetical protein